MVFVVSLEIVVFLFICLYRRMRMTPMALDFLLLKRSFFCLSSLWTGVAFALQFDALKRFKLRLRAVLARVDRFVIAILIKFLYRVQVLIELMTK